MIEARSNYGHSVILEGIHPRKELLNKLGERHAEKIYRDKKDGRTVSVGYIVRGEWFTFYNLTPWEVEA